MSSELKFKARWKALYAHLPPPEGVSEAVITPAEVAARAGVKITTVTGGYMNRLTGALKPDCYLESETPGEWNMVYFRLSTVMRFLDAKTTRRANAKTKFQNHRTTPAERTPKVAA